MKEALRFTVMMRSAILSDEACHRRAAKRRLNRTGSPPSPPRGHSGHMGEGGGGGGEGGGAGALGAWRRKHHLPPPPVLQDASRGEGGGGEGGERGRTRRRLSTVRLIEPAVRSEPQGPTGGGWGGGPLFTSKRDGGEGGNVSGRRRGHMTWRGGVAARRPPGQPVGVCHARLFSEDG